MDATQYDQLWDSIKRSPFGSTYLVELYTCRLWLAPPRATHKVLSRPIEMV